MGISVLLDWAGAESVFFEGEKKGETFLFLNCELLNANYRSYSGWFGGKL